jgi:hypothetical protein
MTLRNGHGWMFFFGIILPSSGSSAPSCNPLAHRQPHARSKALWGSRSR